MSTRPSCPQTRSLLAVWIGSALLLGLVADPAGAARRRNHESIGHLTFASPQVNPIALSPNGSLVLVAATTSNRVDAIDTGLDVNFRSVAVGLDPVSIAFRPDGREAWVANHVSDSVSVIDTDSSSPTYLQVIETIQDFDANGATLFDEPVGIAFASNSKAYVALSSMDQIAVVDASTYSVQTARLEIRAQDPRAIQVANGRLYVSAFESGNQSELSSCALSGSSPQCTLFLSDLVAFGTNPNIPGEIKNIVLDPDVPDRDLFVFDTTTDNEIKAVSGVGTLLYGLAVDANDRVYVTQTDARNLENGTVSPAGARQDVNADGDVNVADLENRMFKNEVAILDCGVGGSSCAIVQTVGLDGATPTPATALATPIGVAVSADGTTVVGTAAGTHRLFSMSSSGTVLDRLDVGAVPSGVALRSVAGTGAPDRAYVLDTLDNTVRVVDVSTPSNLLLLSTIAIGADPTPDAVRRGRIAFNDAFASSNGSFSCGSCHPDANTDQLLWRIGGECFLSGCVAGEDEPRSTMPIRGLRDTVPLHWDGTLGDPFGGPNGASGSGGNPGSNCNGANPHSCFRQLADASLSGVMCDQSGGCATGPSGLPGELTNQERDDLATFLERVSYPPARRRPMDDLVTASAIVGFDDFFTDRGGSSNPSTCADSTAGCHELPLGTGTNSETLEAFEVPTMRGMTDRFLQFSLGITASEELLVFANSGLPPTASPLEPSIQWDPNVGFREITTFGVAFALFEPVYNVRPLDLFQMFEEASTGHSGATGRQVTVNQRTSTGAVLSVTQALLDELEAADLRGVINLRGNGLRAGSVVTFSYKAGLDRYAVGPDQITRATLLAEAQAGTTLVTLTGHLRSAVSEDNPQPLIAPPGANCNSSGPTGDPGLPSGTTFVLESKYVSPGDVVLVDGAVVSTASITALGGSPVCGSDSVVPDRIQVSLGTSFGSGTHLLQVLDASGLISNEVPFRP